MINRDWEERLIRGPYDVRANKIIIESIREKVLNSGEKRRRLRLIWTFPIVSLLGILFYVWMWNAPHQTFQNELASTLSNEDILQIIEHNRPNAERGILYKDSVGSNGQIIFTNIINTELKGMTWEVGYLDGKSDNWISGGEAWVDFVTRTQLEDTINHGSMNITAMYIGAKEDTPFPIIYGPLTDPRITHIRITGDHNFQQTVKVIRNVYGGFSLWYSYVPDTMDTSLDIELMDTEGNIMEIYNAFVDISGVTLNMTAHMKK